MPSGRDTFVRTGLPLIGLVVGGWVGISWILQGRFEIKVNHLAVGGGATEVLIEAWHEPCREPRRSDWRLTWNTALRGQVSHLIWIRSFRYVQPAALHTDHA